MVEREQLPAAGVPEVSDAKLRVFQSLWVNDPSTIRQLTERLCPTVTSAVYSTVQKFLDRLEKDRCVRRDRSNMPHVFEAMVSREAYIGGQLRTMAEKLCGGSLTPLITHLVKTETLSEKERSELRRLLERSEQRSGKK
jgi:predicted transcriptional regulator